jgi:putative ATPase
MQRKAVLYDKGGDRHYDLISAWIKSTRGSDPDASLLYLAAMIEGGEDPRFIARRMLVLASEDIGNADPSALTVAVSTAHAVEHVGMPECAHNLAQCAVYLALAPKSNASYRALADARRWVREHGPVNPPDALRSAAYPGAKKLGRGKDYDYPHSRPEGVSPQELMPPEAAGESFLELSEHGAERELRERLERIRKARGRA